MKVTVSPSFDNYPYIGISNAVQILDHDLFMVSDIVL